jgi:hypothetical protein
MFTNQQVNWRARYKRLQDDKKEALLYWRSMTEYEKSVAGKALDDQEKLYRPQIEAGAIGEFRTAIETHESHRAQLERARAEEARSFDGAKLAGEMAVFEKRLQTALNQAEPAKALRGVLQEAVLSGDVYKVRAATEGLQGLQAGLVHREPGLMLEVNRVAREGQRHLEELRVTPAIRAKTEQAEQSLQQVNALGSELMGLREYFSDVQGPITQALKGKF